MIKTAAQILVEIDDAKRLEKLRAARDEAFSRPDRKPRPTPVKPRPKPRTDRRGRLADREADARAYRLAAIEHGVYLLLPRDMYGRKP